MSWALGQDWATLSPHILARRMASVYIDCRGSEHFHRKSLAIVFPLITENNEKTQASLETFPSFVPYDNGS